MSRYDLTDFEWRVMEPILPNKPRGVPRVDDRRMLNGICYVAFYNAVGPQSALGDRTHDQLYFAQPLPAAA